MTTFADDHTPLPLKSSTLEARDDTTPDVSNPNEEGDILMIEADPLLRRQVRLSRIREDEGAVEYAARLFFSGQHMDDAAQLARVSERRLRAFLKTTQGRAIAQDVSDELDDEFKGLYGDAIDVLRSAMRNEKAEIRMNAANSALRYLKEIKLHVDIGAEDLVQKIMKGDAVSAGEAEMGGRKGTLEDE